MLPHISEITEDQPGQLFSHSEMIDPYGIAGLAFANWVFMQ